MGADGDLEVVFSEGMCESNIIGSTTGWWVSTDTMKPMSWSVRGLRNPRTVRRLRLRLRHPLKLYKPQVVLFMETKLDSTRMGKVQRKCGFVHGIDVGVRGSKGGLSLAWKEDVKVSLWCFSNSFIDVMIHSSEPECEWCFTSFYGSPFLGNKDALWDELRRLDMDASSSWLVYGTLMKFFTPRRRERVFQERKSE